MPIERFLEIPEYVYILLALWEVIWKGFGLWRAAKRDEKYWFVAILVVNTIGLLPMAYLLYTRPRDDAPIQA